MSFATTVVVNPTPAVCGLRASVETAKWSLAAGATLTVAEPLTAPSATETDREPDVFSVVEKVCTPLSPATKV